jgi:phosphatidylglycerol:prolipoprotein diacylglycerol transferase
MISFPNIDPVLLEIGPLAIRWYSLSYLVGILGGWWYLLKLDNQTPRIMSVKVREDLVLWAIVGIVLGGRFGYVLFYNLPFYFDNPAAALKVWEGGMSFHGGMLGLITTFYLMCSRYNADFLAFMDRVACVAPIGLMLGRLANFVNGELYGRVSDAPWAMVFPHDPAQLPRHPSQLYQASLEGLALFIILNILFYFTRIRSIKGAMSGTFLIGYAVFRSIAEFFREPDTQLGFIVGDITMGQILCIPMALAGIAIIIYARRAR